MKETTYYFMITILALRHLESASHYAMYFVSTVTRFDIYISMFLNSIIHIQINASFRFVLVKYAYGFALSFGLKNDGTIPLYFLSIFVSTIYTFLVSFFPIVSTLSKHDTKNLYSLFWGLSPYNSSNYQKMIVAQVPFIAFIVILFVNVQIIKRRTRFKKKHNQFNIITFNQNFFFYIFFYISNVILILIRINILNFVSIKRAENIILYVYLVFLSIDWFVRPIVIIILLRKNMPDFFEDFEISKDKKVFNVRRKAIIPRQQEFLTYKPFSQNARWGSSKKFHVSHEKICKQMPDVNL